ncbi:MAG: hypothetical protein BGO98_12485 [Myxococcales bacterium 68-20]|nr:MAG: hypothetical protein BGO98_12485 [Myxococcales bacterium 68-20]
MRVYASCASRPDSLLTLPADCSSVVVRGTAHAHRSLVASASFVLGFVEKEIVLLIQPTVGRSVANGVGASPESEPFVPLPSIAVLASLVGRFFPAVAEWSLVSAPLDWIASTRSATDTRLEVGRRCT